ncbi:TetR/AcrR family transcriptional regulator C-terminal domain-containing protein [Actinoplanes oblitus]|uniref:TetR/AcrR family transcriptional regulator C-terminal domain-containing protein n=1 Tax=Actinoplanes oblitus TaxID=3040509 RepID=A0ABY8WA34_9ACTN|nr:TetR/AcrR family transcriptional regulator C-terminal domain-containing protein [Actinoplanes oblitus]WIM93298.1 TetR/AcrR family transcriptional regulator C-terminal domain-containing protein [Actinoplanes oblitus]
MSPRREPVSRRDRPAKPPLSRAGAVAVALRIMREEGLERLTMRRLATELDTGPASLYVYVRNTAELHGAILDELLADLTLPPPDPARWRDQLVELMTAYTRLLIAWPSLARSVLALRPSGPHYVRLIETLLGLLRAGGVPVGQAAWGVDLLLQLGTATAAEQGTRGEAADADDEHRMLVTELREASEQEFPHIAQARDELFSGTGEQRLAWAFNVLVEGVQGVPALPNHRAS